VTGHYTRRWFASISIRARFHIMIAVLIVAEALIVAGALHAMRLQSGASSELARVATVQRALDRALTLHTSVGSQLESGAAANAGPASLVEALRAQIESIWALPANAEVTGALEGLRQPAEQYLQSAAGFLSQGGNAESGVAWGFAEMEPKRVALESALRECMTRMRGVLHRVETRVILEAGRNDIVTFWVIAGAVVAAILATLMFMGIAYSIQESIRSVRDVAQSLAAGDMDNRCEIHGKDEVGSLARMVNTLADTMGNMITRLRSEASRSKFSNQLVEALEMADSEAEADRVIARAMNAISEVHPMELLLADSSRAHLERACAHPKQGAAGCPVESPFSCIAVRRGHPLVFPDAEALNACPKLLGRMGGAISAACVPVNFMGRALGVLHVTGAKGQPPDAEQVAQLTALGVHAGNRIGTLRAFERSQLQASTDSLTGLSNRRVAEEVLMNLMAAETPFAVVMADLDYFKRLNDTMGHEAGDRALKLFGDTARSIVRDRDHVIRWGGEEFALLLPGANAERAVEVVGRLRAALAQSLLLSGTPIFTASFGVADSTMTRDRESLIRIADDALYHAKQDGRDRCNVGDPQLLGLSGPRRERDQSGAVVDPTRIAKAVVS
jgi:diguanylate cyclase (GGDEF)-like protein